MEWRNKNKGDRKPFSRFLVYKEIRKRCAQLGIKDIMGTHSFRRSVATRLNEQNIPVEKIAEELGHENINTTKKYIKSEPRLEESPLLKLSYD